MDECRTGFFLKLARISIGVVICSLDKLDLSAESFGSLDLADRSSVRHADNALCTHAGRSQSHALCVISRAAGDNAGSFLLFAQSADLEICASQLETACYLQVLSLEKDLVSIAEMRRIDEISLSRYIFEGK